MFTKTYEVAVREDAPLGNNLVKMEAKGRDNRQVYYEIMNGDPYHMFTVGFTSGELIVAGSFNLWVLLITRFQILLCSLEPLVASTQ